MLAPLSQRLTALIDDEGNRNSWLFATLALLIPIFLMCGGQPLRHNENAYLPILYHWADPNFLASDWSMEAQHLDRWLFHASFSWMPSVFSMPTAAWVGRLLAWCLAADAIMRLAKALGLTPGVAAISVTLWLFLEQTTFGGAWVFGTFEAKCFAYAAMFYSLSQLLEQRWRSAGALLGLCLSLHAAVGLQAVFATGCLLLLERLLLPEKVAWKSLRDFGIPFALTSALGWGLLGWTLAHGKQTSSEELEYLVMERLPHHLAFSEFEPSQILAALGMVGFCGATAAMTKSNETRKLCWFLLGTSLIALGGVAAFYLQLWKLLLLTPFRLFPLISALFFFLFVGKLLSRQSGKLNRPLVAFALLVALESESVGETVRVELFANIYSYKESIPSEDAGAYDWIQKNTPEDAIVMAHPFRYDFSWRAQRAGIVWWNNVRYDDIHGFRIRLMDLTGGPGGRSEAIEYFDSLSEERVNELADEYGATWLLSRGEYSFERVFSKNGLSLYDLREK